MEMETEAAPLHPPAGANQNKSLSERPSMCSSHLRPPERKYIPDSHLLIYRQMNQRWLPLSTLRMRVCVRNEDAQQGNGMRDEAVFGVRVLGWMENN